MVSSYSDRRLATAGRRNGKRPRQQPPNQPPNLKDGLVLTKTFTIQSPVPVFRATPKVCPRTPSEIASAARLLKVLDSQAALANQGSELPRCFSTSAPARIQGKWVKRDFVGADRPATAASMSEDVEWFHSVMDSSSCRDRDNTTAKDSGRFCRGRHYYHTLYSHLWVPTNCILVPMAVLLNGTSENDGGSLFHDSTRSLLLIGDSLMGQLKHTLDCLLYSVVTKKDDGAPPSGLDSNSSSSTDDGGTTATGVVDNTIAAASPIDVRDLNRLTVVSKGGAVLERGGLPLRNETRKKSLINLLAQADVALFNTGAHYNLAMHCSQSERKQNPNTFPECSNNPLASRHSSSAHHSHSHNHQARAAGEGSGGGSGTAALLLKNKKPDLAADFSEFLTRSEAAAEAPACPERVIWRETLPQHWGSIGGSYNEEQTMACSSIGGGAGDEDGAGETGGPQQPMPQGKGRKRTAEVAAATAKMVARWRNNVTTPLVLQAGFGFLPTFDVALPRHDSHPPLAPQHKGQQNLADCTHFCLDSAVNAALSSLALNAIANALAVFPAPFDHSS